MGTTHEIKAMTDDEARQFAEATLLETIRGDMGDFSLKIWRRDGRYSVEVCADPKEGPCFSTGTTFAEAWLAGGTESQPAPVIREVIRGGRTDG